ncbi:hypothetical protein SAMN05444672_11633 [Bacillus sp. OK838]|nr:hypothetical protein SAMN05444672_11633 [Bacillus sp. OK838]
MKLTIKAIKLLLQKESFRRFKFIACTNRLNLILKRQIKTLWLTKKNERQEEGRKGGEGL